MSYRFVNVLRYSYICLYVIELAVTLTAVLRLLNTLKGGGVGEGGVSTRSMAALTSSTNTVTPSVRCQSTFIIMAHRLSYRLYICHSN